jgi:hypothetical protein
MAYIIPGTNIYGSSSSDGVPYTGATQDVDLGSYNLSVDDEAYGAGWDGSLEVPTKNAVYDKIETLASGHDAVTLDANADTIFSLSTQELGLDTQTANYVWAGPVSGAAAVPTFRALVADDIPDLSGTYLTSETDPVVGAITGIIKANGAGVISAATAGTDYFNASSHVTHDDTTGFVANEHIDWTNASVAFETSSTVTAFGGVTAGLSSVSGSTITDNTASLTSGRLSGLTGGLNMGADASKIELGLGSDGELYVVADDVVIANVTQDKDILLKVNDGGVTKTLIKLDADIGSVDFTGGNKIYVNDIDIDSPVSVYNLNHDSFSGFVANEHIDWTNASSAFVTTQNSTVGGADNEVQQTIKMNASQSVDALRVLDSSDNTKFTISQNGYMTLAGETDSFDRYAVGMNEAKSVTGIQATSVFNIVRDITATANNDRAHIGMIFDMRLSGTYDYTRTAGTGGLTIAQCTWRSYTSGTVSEITGLGVSGVIDTGTVSSYSGIALLTPSKTNGGTLTQAIQIDVFNTGATTGYAIYTRDDIVSIGGNFILRSVPTSDPAVAGQVWSDGGTLTLSAG